MLVLLPLFFAPVVQAKENVNPDNSSSYKVKRLKEKVTLIFKFSAKAKSAHLSKLLAKRMDELTYIVENKKMFYFEKATLRYSATAGQLSEVIVAKSLKSEAGSAKEQMEAYIPQIEKLQENFSSDSAEWRFLQDDINSLKIYIDKLTSI